MPPMLLHRCYPGGILDGMTATTAEELAPEHEEVA
jgi:hypothetical protein